MSKEKLLEFDSFGSGLVDPEMKAVSLSNAIDDVILHIVGFLKNRKVDFNQILSSKMNNGVGGQSIRCFDTATSPLQFKEET